MYFDRDKTQPQYFRIVITLKRAIFTNITIRNWMAF